MPTVGISGDSFRENHQRPDLRGEIVVLGRSTHTDSLGKITILNATACEVVNAYDVPDKLGNASGSTRLLLAPGQRLIKASLPLVEARGSAHPMRDTPRLLPLTARRLTVEQCLDGDIDVQAAYLLDEDDQSLRADISAIREEHIYPWVAGLRGDNHPFSRHAAKVIATATRSFRAQKQA